MNRVEYALNLRAMGYNCSQAVAYAFKDIVDIDEKTLYRITYVLKDVEKYGLDKDYCILAIKKLDIKEI